MRHKHVASICLILLPILLSTQSPQPATQSPQPATQSPQPATQSPQPATQSPQPATQSPQHLLQPAQDTTYADRLGFPKGARVLILHVDDAGMSLESNEGAIAALTRGAATSVSVMMPCPWVPGFVKWLKTHPDIDAGLHLTLTSEWNDYRWRPLSGQAVRPYRQHRQPLVNRRRGSTTRYPR